MAQTGCIVTIGHMTLPHVDNGDLLLASCSQDTYIRVWRLSSSAGDEEKDEEILQLKGNQFHVEEEGKKVDYIVTLETVLLGHEDWVYSVRWQPPAVGIGMVCGAHVIVM